MTRITLDAYALGCPGSEETVALAQASAREFASWDAFVKRARMDAGLTVPQGPLDARCVVDLADPAVSGRVAALLALGQSVIDVDLDRVEARQLTDDRWEHEVVLVEPGTYTWLRWETTA